MTREQAQEAFKKNLREFPSLLEQTDRAIDLYVALGMLKLDEPKSEVQTFIDIVVGRVGASEGVKIYNAIEAAGLKIVSV